MSATWTKHAPLPWSVDDDDPKCVRDARWVVLVDVLTGNDEADRQIARLIADAGNAYEASPDTPPAPNPRKQESR